MTATAKHVYSLEPAWNEEHDYPFHLVDQPDMLFDCEGNLDKPRSLKGQWRLPELVVHEHRLPADIYWCLGDAFFFSSTAQTCVADAMGEDVEWLPVSISDLGRFYVLHPLREVPLAPDALIETNPVSRNITVIREHRFRQEDLDGVNVFMPAQARGSAAARAGFSFGKVLIADNVQRRLVESGLVGVRCHECTSITV